MGARTAESAAAEGRARAGPPLVRTLLNLGLVAGIAYGGWTVLASAMHAARVRSDVAAVRLEARKLFDGFERYYARHQAYPNAYADPAFDGATFEPLRRRGYYSGFVDVKLAQRRIDAFDSPDDKGLNQEFWLEMTLARDPRVRFLVASSNDAPLGGGKWREGAFLWRDGVLEPL